ncbi:DUF3077 domain-containing protein [Pseudomonas sp. NPDC087615]|uniref:DUF3077 domain-containing protein n=1 Tax=Pseudomonas sp. NPDC087615 TaxID=3364443 RepID=UPI0037FD51F2
MGFTPFIYDSDNALFHVSAGVRVSEALSQASDLPGLAKSFAEDAAFMRHTDRYAWVAYYLTAMGKAVINDVKTQEVGTQSRKIAVGRSYYPPRNEKAPQIFIYGAFSM